MARGLSTKRLAVAQRYSKRLMALEKKGFDIEPLKAEIKKIPGVKITKKGISISEAVYKKSGESIRSSLEGIVKTTKEYSNLLKKRERKIKRAADYMKAVRNRVESLSSTFGIAKEDFLERVAEVEGVLVTKLGNVYIDPDLLDADIRAAIREKLGSERSLLAEAKEALMSEDGLSEADIELLGKEGLKKKVVSMRVFESDTSVFKKFYEVFDKENKGSVLPQYGSSSRLNASSFDDLYDAMVELGHIVHDSGYKNDYWSQKKEVERLINRVKNI